MPTHIYMLRAAILGRWDQKAADICHVFHKKIY